MDTPPRNEPEIENESEMEEITQNESGIDTTIDTSEIVDPDGQQEALPNIEGSISSGVQIAPTNDTNDVAEEEDTYLFIELGDRVVIDSKKYGRTVGYVYYRSEELIRILPDGVSYMLMDFPVIQNDEGEEFDEDLGVTSVYIIEKRKFESFVEQQDLRVGQLVETITKSGDIESEYKITKVNRGEDSIEITDELGDEREIDFGYYGIPLDESFVIIRKRQEPIVPELEEIKDENTKTLEEIQDEERKEEEEAEEENEDEGVDVVGFVTLAKATVFKEAPVIQQRFPDNLQKVDALNDFLNMLDTNLQKDQNAIRSVRILVETLFYLKQATVQYNEDGSVKGQQVVSASTIADLIKSVNIPISRPVLNIAKKLYYVEGEQGEEEGEQSTMTDTDEYFFRNFETDLNGEITRTSKIVSSVMKGAEENKVNQHWNDTASYLKEYCSTFIPNSISEPLWKAIADTDIFRYEAPDMDVTAVPGLVASHSEKAPPVLSELNFAMERALTSTYRKGSERRKQLLIGEDAATMNSYLMFPLKAVAHLGTKRSGDLAIDSGRSQMTPKTMRMVLEEVGNPKEVGTSNDLLLLDVNGNTLGNIPIGDYLEGISIPALGLGDTFSTLQQFGFDSLELTPEIAKVLETKIQGYQSQLITTLSNLRELLQRDNELTPEDNNFIENLNILEGNIRQEPTLVDDLNEYERINTTLSKSDIGQIAYLLKKHSDYFQVAAGNNPVYTAKERIRAARDIFVDTLHIAKLLKQKKLDEGAQPIPNKCEHVAKLVTIRKIYDDSERFKALTKFFAYYQGGRDNNWINCNVCSQHLLCIHERLQIQAYLDVNQRESLQKEIVLNFSGGQFQGKFICRNCGQPIKDIEFDTNLEYDDEGRPMMGRSELVDEDEIDKENLEKALQTPVYSKGEMDTTLDTAQKEFYNIVKEISIRVGIDLTNESYLNIINSAIKIFNELPSKEIYSQIVKKIGKEMPEYDVMINRNQIIYSACFLLFEIQTHIPSYPVRYVLQACKEPGFDGYPLIDDIKNKQGINYIACAVASVGKNDAPWNKAGFPRDGTLDRAVAFIANSMEVTFKKIMTNDIARQKIADKNKFLSEVKTYKGSKDNIFPSFLPEQIIIKPSEAAENPIIPEVVQNLNTSAAKYALAKQWIRMSHILAHKTASLVRGSKMIETTCCLANIQQPSTFWESASNLPHLDKRQLVPNRQGSFLQVHFTPRPAESLLVKPDSEFYYRLFLKCCFQGSRKGYSHEPGLTNKCAWCGFQFPSNPNIIDTDTEGKMALSSQQVKTGQEEFTSLLDKIHQVNAVELKNDRKVSSMESILLELGSITPPPLNGWKEIIEETIRGFISLPKDADRGDIAQTIGLLSDATDQATRILETKLPPKFLEIITNINNLPWIDWFKVILTYFVIPFNRILSNFNTKSLFVPSELKLSSKHVEDIDGILNKDTVIVSMKKEEILKPQVSLARVKMQHFLKQMSALLPFKDKVRPTIVPGRELTLKYFQRAMMMGTLSELVNSNTIPEGADISTPLKTVIDKSMKSLIELIAMNLTKYNSESLNFSDERIKEMIAARSEKEKVEIIKKFDRMSDEEKTVELMKKRLGMGDWAVGGTKLIWAYDPEQYDREREQRERAGIIDFPGLGPYDVPNLDGRQVDELGFFEVGQENDYEREEGGYDFEQTREDDA